MVEIEKLPKTIIVLIALISSDQQSWKFTQNLHILQMVAFCDREMSIYTKRSRHEAVSLWYKM